MDFDGSSFAASLLVSGIGFVAFSCGKSMKRLPQMAIGAALMVFPYFVDSWVLMLVIAAALLAALFAAIRLGI